MAAIASHLPTAKGFSRVRTSGLKVRTSFTDNTSNEKAKALASSDWRKTASASALSSSGSSVKNMRSRLQDSRSSGESSSVMMVEMEDMSSDSIHYHRPIKDGQATWEMVESAPELKPSIPPANVPSLSLSEVTMVQFSKMTPVVVKVNDEDMVLPNRFTFDISPIDIMSISSSSRDSPVQTFGELKRVKNPSQLRYQSSEDHCLLDMPEDLQAILRYDQISSASDIASSDSLVRRFSSSFKHHRGIDTAKARNSDSAIDIQSDSRPQKNHTRERKDDANRFQNLIERLHKSETPKPASPHKPERLAPEMCDPAIVAAKVKTNGLTGSGKKREPTEEIYQRHINWLQGVGQQSSGDSGYGSHSSNQMTGNHLMSNIRTTTDSVHKLNLGGETKRGLNPAAAEFRSFRPAAPMAVFSPRRLSRPPLSNLFPDTTANQTPGPPTIPYLAPPSGLGQVAETMAAHRAPASPGKATANAPRPSEIKAPTAQIPPTIAPPTAPFFYNPADLGTLPPGIFAGSLPPLDVLARHLLPPTMSSSALYHTLNHLPMAMAANNLGTFPFLPMQPMETTAPPMGLPTNGVNAPSAFPPPPRTAMPAHSIPPQLTAAPAAASFAMRPPPGLQLPTTAAHITTPLVPPVTAASFDPDGKVIRPHFPVTQKPRDHDPIKQQQYEAYLEWRKVNEPGYHMRCKMRQANRVVRQHQQHQQQQGLRKPGPGPSGSGGGIQGQYQGQQQPHHDDA
ncbi:hypothetical protein B0T17DRAFT_359535 [Bombardia bombarda]|uniref:Uncharacterized protein n=1 Tax=Bombardia bombarda TaxID=252184 RepID=A0AA39WI81_9PEZI|nr:hypothetical protein B0T17DRAFT_359535 [Bombardia bombarda]